jgi:hypothetical protein
MSLTQLIGMARVSRGTWELLERCHREVTPPAPPPGPPVRLIPPVAGEEADAELRARPDALSASEEAAAIEADAARRRVQEAIDALSDDRAPRCADCGTGRQLYLRRKAPGKTTGAVDDMLVRVSCGRSSCPYCWRKRLMKTYRRCSSCLLDADQDSSRPRAGMLHAGEIDWPGWDSWDRVYRRRHGGRSGRLRVRREDDTVLVVAEHPFPGARPVSPAEAVDLVRGAVGKMHTAKHSYRQLGAWSDRRATQWRLLGRVDPHVDFGDVQAEVERLGGKARRLRHLDMEFLLWRCDSEAAADALFSALPLAEPLSGYRQRESRSPHWLQSDTGGSGDDDDDPENPFP